VTYLALGQRGKAVEYYTSSYETAERRGDGRRAAYSRANAGAVLIEHGDRPDDGLRFVEGALRVVRELEDKTFDVFCLQLIAAHARFTGRYEQALSGVRSALVTARERKLSEDVAALLLDEARILMETGAYVEARARLDEAIATGAAQKPSELLIERARVDARLGDVEHARQMLDQARALPESMGGEIRPRLHAATGEVAYAAGDLKQARVSFGEAARLWTDDLPDAASVESRARAGMLDALAGKPAGRAAIETSLEEGQRMKRPSLEVLARVFLAQLDVLGGRPQQATDMLAPARLNAVGPELQAQVHHWRAAAAAATGDAATAEKERREVEQILSSLRNSVPEALQSRFVLRPDVRALSQ